MRDTRSPEGPQARVVGARGVAIFAGVALWCLVGALGAADAPAGGPGKKKAADAPLGVQGKLKNFRFPPEYYPPSPQRTNQAVKTLLSGAEAWPLPDGQVRINGLRIETFREDGQPELEVKASECVVDIATREASGAGHLQAVTANGLYGLEGEGFRWQQSNAVLVISNRVVTTFQRSILGSSAFGLGPATNTPVTARPGATNETVRISSDRCVFESQSNRVVLDGHVLVEDPQLELACGVLRVQLTPERRLRRLSAEEGVSILNKTDQSRATAGRAVYEIEGAQETVSLLEAPVWRDREGGIEARAERFILDRAAAEIRGVGGAQLRLPRGRIEQPWLGAERPLTATNAPGPASQTNQVEITSETLTLLLPATNRPHRSAVAEGSVVILSPADKARASADKVTYREDQGLIEMQGQGRWESEGRLVRADWLSVDPTNRVFLGRGNVLFRQPLQPAGRALPTRQGTNRLAATNLVLEIRSDSFAYRTNTLVFEGETVRARLLEGSILRGVLTCGALAAHFSNRLEQVIADKRVVAEHYPPPGRAGQAVTNLLSCERLTAIVSPDGGQVSLRATDNVQAAQIEHFASTNKTIVTDLTCGLLTGLILAKAGKVDRLEAEQHVVVSQLDKRATAGCAVYTDREQQVVLSDHPYAEFEDGKIKDAQTLTWDRRTGAFRGQGRYRIEWTRPPGATNPLVLPFLPTTSKAPEKTGKPKP